MIKKGKNMLERVNVYLTLCLWVLSGFHGVGTMDMTFVSTLSLLQGSFFGSGSVSNAFIGEPLSPSVGRFFLLSC